MQEQQQNEMGGTPQQPPPDTSGSDEQRVRAEQEQREREAREQREQEQREQRQRREASRRERRGDDVRAEDEREERREARSGYRFLDKAVGGDEVPQGPLGGPYTRQLNRVEVLAREELRRQPSADAERAAIEAAKGYMKPIQEAEDNLEPAPGFERPREIARPFTERRTFPPPIDPRRPGAPRTSEDEGPMETPVVADPALREQSGEQPADPERPVREERAVA